jgi:hypothetical protein
MRRQAAARRVPTPAPSCDRARTTAPRSRQRRERRPLRRACQRPQSHVLRRAMRVSAGLSDTFRSASSDRRLRTAAGSSSRTTDRVSTLRGRQASGATSPPGYAIEIIDLRAAQEAPASNSKRDAAIGHAPGLVLRLDVGQGAKFFEWGRTFAWCRARLHISRDGAGAEVQRTSARDGPAYSVVC